MSANPGRVFKGKKMHGKMGGKPKKILKLQVFKIDYDRGLIYVKGSVPGKQGDLIEITDAFFHNKMNEGKINYPTFVPKEGVRYADIVQVEVNHQDPSEDFLHDEALPKYRNELGGDDDEGGEK